MRKPPLIDQNSWLDRLEIEGRKERFEELTIQCNIKSNRISELESEIARMRHAYDAYEHEIQQLLGKALGYPWFKDDQKNFTGATEADGVCVGEHVAETIVAELAKKHAEANERIKRLEEAGNMMKNDLLNHYRETGSINAWNAANESKL